jgi:hypothetical protein
MVTEWLVISRKNTPASRWSSDNQLTSND